MPHVFVSKKDDKCDKKPLELGKFYPFARKGEGEWGKGEGKRGEGEGRESKRRVTSKDSLFLFIQIFTIVFLKSDSSL